MKVLDVGFDETGNAMISKVQYADGRIVHQVTPCVPPEEMARINAHMEAL